MFKWIDKIIAIFSPMMRNTIELGELNEIWERFNNGEDIRNDLRSRKWKYHQKKVDLLFEIIKVNKSFI